jgi:pimeloyl-ACP methyl ester carboxylesterase
MKKSHIVIITVILLLIAIPVTFYYMGKSPDKRPQEPSKPYPYTSEEVKFENTIQDLTLSGTLTLPSGAGRHPAVILISGSGPQNRDEEILGHKPFLVLADHLTKNGIAVLRYDDRGTGASTGSFKNATTADFSTDAESALHYLKTRKDIDTTQIGLIGHSEGGLVAPMLAARSADVAFMVLLGSPAVRNLQELLLKQDELIARSFGISEKEIEQMKKVNRTAYLLVATATDSDSLKQKLTVLAKNNALKIPAQLIPKGMSKEQFMSARVDDLSSSWARYMMRYDPSEALSKVHCPVLALNGEKDLQVTPKDNLAAIQSILTKSGNTRVVTKELKNLNHLFQECETGSPKEYAEIDQTFSPTALSEISNWLKAQLK